MKDFKRYFPVGAAHYAVQAGSNFESGWNPKV